jgi:hypothetical protein
MIILDHCQMGTPVIPWLHLTKRHCDEYAFCEEMFLRHVFQTESYHAFVVPIDQNQINPSELFKAKYED